MCGTNGAARVYIGGSGDPTNIANGHNLHAITNPTNLGINTYHSEVSDFAVMEVITWNRALSDAEMMESVDYLSEKLRSDDGPPARSMVAWFKSEDAGPNWPNALGGAGASVISGQVTTETGEGHGAKKPVTYISGGSGDKLSFGNVLPGTFSICSISRYTGSNQKRILTSSTSNWLHGHWNKQSGVAHYTHGWNTGHQRNEGSKDWLVMCGTNGAARVYIGGSGDPTNIANGHNLHAITNPSNLGINNGRYSEVSDFAVMEVITWNRALSDDEMKKSMKYLQSKLKKDPEVACPDREVGHGGNPSCDDQTVDNCLKSYTMQGLTALRCGISSGKCLATGPSCKLKD